jgi:hypothetical protein
VALVDDDMLVERELVERLAEVLEEVESALFVPGTA